MISKFLYITFFATLAFAFDTYLVSSATTVAISLEPCREEVIGSKRLITQYLTDDHFSGKRDYYNIPEMNENEIELIEANQSQCTQLKSSYDAAHGERVVNVFYKARNFYFVVAKIQNSPNDDIVVLGNDVIVVLDSQLQEIGKAVF